MNLIYELDPKLKAYKLEDILIEPIIVTVNDFTETSAKIFAADMNKAQRTGQEIIPIVIDSYGGAAYALLSMIDTIRSCPLQVATIVQGKAMSCGSILFSFGTKEMRYAAPYSTLLIHQLAHGTWGKLEETQVKVKECERLSKLIYSEMSKNCGQEPKFLHEEMIKRNNADWYLTPTQAKKIGLVDHIKIPTFTTKVNITQVLS